MRILIIFLLFTAQASALNVVTTIKPLYGLTAAIMKNVGTPTLLLADAASPHTYTLKPSDMATLIKADMVVWVGPAMESFLTKALAVHVPLHKQCTLMETPGLTLYPTYQGDHTCCDHHHGPMDAHIWLDPLNAITMAHVITDKLVAADPVHAATYRTNMKTLKVSLLQLHKTLEHDFKAMPKKPFFVFHDAYQYLEKRYGLQKTGVLLLSPDVPPSPKKLQAIQAAVAHYKDACLFAEPQFSFKAIAAFFAHTPLIYGTLDPLGSSLALTDNLYTELMLAIRNQLRKCFTS